MEAKNTYIKKTTLDIELYGEYIQCFTYSHSYHLSRRLYGVKNLANNLPPFD